MTKPAGVIDSAWPRLIHAEVAVLARGYAAVLFCSSPAVGAVFALTTFIRPGIGAAGLLAICSAHLFARVLRFPQNGVHLYNALLVGLGLGFAYELNAYLAVLLVLASVFTMFAAQALSAWTWRIGRLPALSGPFVLAAWLMAPALPALSQLVSRTHVEIGGTLVGLGVDGFLTALGAFLFVPHPAAGLALFAGVMWSSRLLALMAVLGYAVGAATLYALGTHGVDPAAYGYNFALSAMALGGVYLLPGLAGTAAALIAAAGSALLSVACVQVIAPLGLPILVIPFLATTICLLAGFSVRHANLSPTLNLDRPDIPERAHEGAVLAAIRGSGLRSIPLYAPFFGTWTVSQGFEGRDTHRAPWQHALDFVISEGGTGHRGDGTRLEHYFCFGAPVAAPAPGTVVALQGDLPDNRPGDANTAQNWGNHVLIRTAAGGYVMLAHLQRGSLKPALGQWVAAGEPIGACGNSGRSLRPHMHLQAQVSAALGAPTMPFHLCGVVNDRGFQFAARPKEGEQLSAAIPDTRLAAALHLAPGRWLRFRLEDGRTERIAELRVELTLLGQFRLISDLGASAAFEENDQAIGYYDRNDVADPLLDLWLLALGLTPLSLAARVWSDSAPARLVPLPVLQRVLIGAASIAATNARSRYMRELRDGEHQWEQMGEHWIAVLPGKAPAARSSAWISPGAGVSRLELRTRSHHLIAHMEGSGLLGEAPSAAA